MANAFHSDPSRPRGRGFRRWIGRKLRKLIDLGDTRTTAPELDTTRSVNQNRIVTFTTPSKGDAYDFTITAELCFCATGPRSVDSLHAKIDAWLPAITTELKFAARPVAREYPPFRPGAAESVVAITAQKAVDMALAGAAGVDGAAVSCAVQVRVDMPEEVRVLQREAVTEQTKFENRFEQSEQAAQRLGELRVAWSKFIRDGLPMWETPYAVLMAQQPGQASAALFKMRADRMDEAAKLVDAVAAAAAGSEKMDLLEFALATDSALKRTYELLGIAAPPDGPTSNFDKQDQNGTSS
jgi:hypothetical protein